MSDLINRKSALKALRPIMRKSDYFYEILKAIQDVPPAEPERKKGVWIRHPEQKNIFGGKTVECSVCGEKYVVQYIEDEKFCRSCGADMRGEQNE